MSTLTATEQKIVEFFKSLSPEAQRAVLFALAGNDAQRSERQQKAESRLRQIAQERGLDWDRMTDEQRLDMVDDLFHEDRGCP